MRVTRQLPDAAATEALGRDMAAALPAGFAGWMLLLDGELGSGKTTLARAFLNGLGHSGAVPSPTYTLVESYEMPRGIVYHIDLYRLNDENELHYLGWDSFGDGLRLIEWPQRAPRMTALADVHVHLAYAGNGRTADIHIASERAARAFDGKLGRHNRGAG
ncbi:MAG: tRNA (adenosine(37)-N6)-threonylcarbamoyltransferase complex ATPase subunit type 1 TsaE [Woeseia sp.]